MIDCPMCGGEGKIAVPFGDCIEYEQCQICLQMKDNTEHGENSNGRDKKADTDT